MFDPISFGHGRSVGQRPTAPAAIPSLSDFDFLGGTLGGRTVGQDANPAANLFIGSLTSEIQQATEEFKRMLGNTNLVAIGWRWEGTKAKGFMGDQPNRTVFFRMGAVLPGTDVGHPQNPALTKDRIEVPSGMKIVGYPSPNFVGTPMTLGPGVHAMRSQGLDVKSAIVLPDQNWNGLLDRWTSTLQMLARPENGCLFNRNNYKTHPAVQAVLGYLDTLIQASGSTTPLAQQFIARKNQLLQTLLQDVIEYGCDGGQAAPAPAQPDAPQAKPDCPVTIDGHCSLDFSLKPMYEACKAQGGTLVRLRGRGIRCQVGDTYLRGRESVDGPAESADEADDVLLITNTPQISGSWRRR